MTNTLRGLPKPTLADIPDGPGQIGALANAADLALGRMGAALQKGVIDGGFAPSQRGAGANMSVDIASNFGTGAFVNDDTTTGQALVYVAPTGSVTNVAIGTAHATLPRIDRVVLSTAGVASVVAGTATSGATLTNLTGAAAVPSSSMLLADVLVGAAVSSITNSVIRDRRSWARGAMYLTTKSSDISKSSATMALVDSVVLQPRLELYSGVLRVALTVADVQSTVASVAGSVDLFVDGATATSSKPYKFTTPPVGSSPGFVSFIWVLALNGGSHLIGPALASDGTNILTLANPLTFSVEEIPRSYGANNVVTSG